MVCPSCGRENPEGQRFCGACGHRLNEQHPPAEVRKTVTVVFSDIAGSTALGERLDPEALRRVMSRYFDVMRAILGSSLEIEASWAPDGRMVAFASNRSGDSDVYLIDVETRRVTRLTDDPVHDADPAWSPDGSQIAFTSHRNDVPHICVMMRDGSDAACVTQGTQPSWSPDGARLTFYRDTPEGTRIFIADSDGSGVRQVT